MSKAPYTATVKRNITPIEITLTITVNRVNENGTFSGNKFVSAKAKGVNLDGLAVSCPPQGGGAMYVKVAGLSGLEFLGDGETAATAEKKKLF